MDKFQHKYADSQCSADQLTSIPGVNQLEDGELLFNCTEEILSKEGLAERRSLHKNEAKMSKMCTTLSRPASNRSKQLPIRNITRKVAVEVYSRVHDPTTTTFVTGRTSDDVRNGIGLDANCNHILYGLRAAGEKDKETLQVGTLPKNQCNWLRIAIEIGPDGQKYPLKDRGQLTASNMMWLLEFYLQDQQDLVHIVNWTLIRWLEGDQLRRATRELLKENPLRMPMLLMVNCLTDPKKQENRRVEHYSALILKKEEDGSEFTHTMTFLHTNLSDVKDMAQGPIAELADQLIGVARKLITINNMYDARLRVMKPRISIRILVLPPALAKPKKFGNSYGFIDGWIIMCQLILFTQAERWTMTCKDVARFARSLMLPLAFGILIPIPVAYSDPERGVVPRPGVYLSDAIQIASVHDGIVHDRDVKQFLRQARDFLKEPKFHQDNAFEIHNYHRDQVMILEPMEMRLCRWIELLTITSIDVGWRIITNYSAPPEYWAEVKKYESTRRAAVTRIRELTKAGRTVKSERLKELIARVEKENKDKPVHQTETLGEMIMRLTPTTTTTAAQLPVPSPASFSTPGHHTPTSAAIQITPGSTAAAMSPDWEKPIPCAQVFAQAAADVFTPFLSVIGQQISAQDAMHAREKDEKDWMKELVRDSEKRIITQVVQQLKPELDQRFRQVEQRVSDTAEAAVDMLSPIVRAEGSRTRESTMSAILGMGESVVTAVIDSMDENWQDVTAMSEAEYFRGRAAQERGSPVPDSGLQSPLIPDDLDRLLGRRAYQRSDRFALDENPIPRRPRQPDENLDEDDMMDE